MALWPFSVPWRSRRTTVLRYDPITFGYLFIYFCIGMDPMTAMAAFLPLFPWLDPFQMMNPSKQDGLPPMSQASMPPAAEMEKMLKSLGLTPEMAMMSGLIPASMMPSTPSSKAEVPKEPKLRPEKPKTEPFTLLPTTSDKPLSIPEKQTPVKKKGISKLDSMFGIGKAEEESPSKSSSSIFGKVSTKCVGKIFKIVYLPTEPGQIQISRALPMTRLMRLKTVTYWSVVTWSSNILSIAFCCKRLQLA